MNYQFSKVVQNRDVLLQHFCSPVPRVSRNQASLDVDTGKEHGGRCFHVIDNILEGMAYEEKRAKQLDDSDTFVSGSAVHIGHVDIKEMPRFTEVCKSIPLPGAQVILMDSHLTHSSLYVDVEIGWMMPKGRFQLKELSSPKTSRSANSRTEIGIICSEWWAIVNTWTSLKLI